MIIKIKKNGGSSFVLVPSEYLKVFNLSKYRFKVNVDKKDNTYILTYTQILKNDMKGGKK